MRLSTALIRQILELSVERDILLQKIGEIDRKMSTFWKKSTFSNKASINRPRRERGAIEKMVVRELACAGSKGMSVKDLANRLQVSPQVVHSWLNTTGKKRPSIKAFGRGVYRLDRRCVAAPKL